MEIAQGFALRTTVDGKTESHLLGQHDFPDLTFRGEYPVAKLEYANAAIPVAVSLEAFSPFIPLEVDDSGLPATIFNFTLKNTSQHPVEATLGGSWENGVCGFSRCNVDRTRRNQIVRGPGMTVMNCSATGIPADAAGRPDIIFEDWAKETFEGWTVEGSAFGSGPVDRATMETNFRTNGGKSPRMANSYFPTGGDAALGKLTSAPFTIQRHYINFWLAGPYRPGEISLNLIVDGKTVKSQTGRNDYVTRLSAFYFDVRKLEGKQATLQIVDASADHDGRITVDRIFFSDLSGDGTSIEQFPDYGTLALALIGKPAEVGIASGAIGFDGEAADEASVPLSEILIGTLGRTVQLQPGESAQVTFILAAFFPNLEIRQLGKGLRYYTNKFSSAQAVAEYVAGNLGKLTDATRLWRDTWYDSTLPYWFLDRTFINTSTLASGTCYRVSSGRFYAYEGAPAPNYEGTCTHVWQYAHSMARTFPQLERDTRERVDLGVALDAPSGVMGFRGDASPGGLAVDGQLGTIMRFYREHQMSPDDLFLKRNWEKIKTTYNPLFALDPNGEGILDGRQNNTLDCAWFGQISWMSSMYVGALRAGEQMAREAGDEAFAQRCAKIAENGTLNITARLYNGEYYFSIIDPKNAEWVNSGDGSHIDQVYGQGWAFQIGLPRVLPEKETRTALQSIWKYNFSTNVDAYLDRNKLDGRRFVQPGGAGMLMCTFPRTDWDYPRSRGTQPYGQSFAGYFNETWTGQEYQVAGHMFWEGMVKEGLAIVRAIHERYSPDIRNPWAEEEAGIHYSRAMASYGAFIGICGYEYHGPKGHIGFAPKLTPENFRAPFTAAEGWGTYAQTLSLVFDGAPAKPVAKATLNGAATAADCAVTEGRLQLQFPADIVIPEGQALTVEIS